MTNIKSNKNSKQLPLLSLLMGVLLLFGACENDLREVEKIEKIQKEEAVDISKNIKIIISDSAIVKAELTSPEMRIYHDTSGNSNSNYEFKKGLQIIFFDAQGKESQRVKSDYGKQRALEGITEFKKNVVITRNDGSIIKTEELYYDEKKKLYYNFVPITFELKDGRGNFQATSFTSDLDFKDIHGQNMTGFYIPSSTNQLPIFGQ